MAVGRQRHSSHDRVARAADDARRSYDQRRIVRCGRAGVLMVADSQTRALVGRRRMEDGALQCYSPPTVLLHPEGWWVSGSRGISRRHICLRSPKSRGKPFLDVAWLRVRASMQALPKGQPVARVNIPRADTERQYLGSSYCTCTVDGSLLAVRGARTTGGHPFPPLFAPSAV